MMAPQRRFGRKNAAILNALYHLDSEQRAALLRKADPTLVRYICECALNVLHGNVPLSNKQKARLRKHVQTLRELAISRGNFPRKKKLIVQRGGFLPALLAPLIGTLLASLVSK